MRPRTLALLSAVLLALGAGIGVFVGRSRAPRPEPKPVTKRIAPTTPSGPRIAPSPQPGPDEAAPEPEPAEPSPRAPIDLEKRLAQFEGEEIGRLEEELEARILEDPKYAEVVYDFFLKETDPMKQSFLQNVIAMHPDLRNDPVWQDRFLEVAESDPVDARRKASLLFVQQAEVLRPSQKDRMFRLAESGNDDEVRLHALVALGGLPDRRAADPQLVETAGRLADNDRFGALRGVALRIENNPEHAARFMLDPDKEVRMQATHVVNDPAIIETALRNEKDDEVRQVLEMRLEDLRKIPR